MFKVTGSEMLHARFRSVEGGRPVGGGACRQPARWAHHTGEAHLQIVFALS